MLRPKKKSEAVMAENSKLESDEDTLGNEF